MRYLKVNAQKFGISNISYDGCNYICFRLDRGNEEQLIEKMKEDIRTNGICCLSLVSSQETPIHDKYDPYIPSDLLKKAYAEDRLWEKEVEERILSL